MRILFKTKKSFISVSFTQSEIAAKEVYLFDLLENMNRESMQNLKCLCFIRPTKQNVQLLVREMKEPKYGQYYICMIFIQFIS